MMTRPIYVLIVAILATCLAKPAFAQGREWSAFQMTLGAAAVSAHLADWGQTRHIARSNEPDYLGARYIEIAPITRDVIGARPKMESVDAYMAVTGLAFIAAAHFLPEYRTAILTVWAVSRIAVVVNNNQIGLSIGGSF